MSAPGERMGTGEAKRRLLDLGAPGGGAAPAWRSLAPLAITAVLLWRRRVPLRVILRVLGIR
jgi:hypothetical protein